MALIYITDDAKKKLNKLIKLEKRTISKEVEMLIDDRHAALTASKLQDTSTLAAGQRN